MAAGLRQWRYCSSSDKVLLLAHGTTDMLALAQRRGGELHRLLSGTSLFEQDLSRPLARISMQEWGRIWQHCQALHSPELPALLGIAILHNRYISLCQALWTARDLRQALRLFCTYRHQLFPALFPQFCPQDGALSIEIKASLGLFGAAALQVQVLFNLLLTLIKQQLGTLEGVHIQLQQAAPSATAIQLLSGLGSEQDLLYSQPCDSISIPLALWQRPFSGADRDKFVAARRTCHQLKRTVGHRAGLLEAIYRQARQHLPAVLTLEQSANQLGISTSMLRRQLSAEHSSFARLLDEARQDAARRILASQICSNRALAMALGYSDEHNFRRAFKRWTGILPSLFKLQPGS